MFRKLLISIAAVGLLAACETQPPAPNLAPAPPPPTVSYMTFFDLGSTRISEQGAGAIAQAAQTYKTRANARLTVTGYADTVGSPANNMQLSQRRADAVKAALVRSGVPADAITTAASGETGLLVDTGPQAKEQRNRRVVIVFN